MSSGAGGSRASATVSLVWSCLLSACALREVQFRARDVGAEATVVDAVGDQASDDAADASRGDAVLEAAFDVESAVAPDVTSEPALVEAGLDGALDASVDAAIDATREVSVDAAVDALFEAAVDAAPTRCPTRRSACGAVSGSACGAGQYCGGCACASCATGTCAGCHCQALPEVRSLRVLREAGASSSTGPLVVAAARGVDGRTYALVRVRRQLTVQQVGGSSVTFPVAAVAAPTAILVRIEDDGAFTELLRLTPQNGRLDTGPGFLRVTPEGDLVLAWSLFGSFSVNDRTIESTQYRSFLLRVPRDESTPVYSELDAGEDGEVFGLELGTGNVAAVGSALRIAGPFGGDIWTVTTAQLIDRDGVRVGSPVRVGDDSATQIAVPGSIAVDADRTLYVTGGATTRTTFLPASGPPTRITSMSSDTVGYLWRLTPGGASSAIYTFAGGSEPLVPGVAVDASGRVYAIAQVFGSLRVFDGAGDLVADVPAPGGSLVRLRLGTAVSGLGYATRFGPASTAYRTSLRVSPRGDAYVAGLGFESSTAASTFVFDNDDPGARFATPSTAMGLGGYVGSVDDDGAFRWMFSLTGASDERVSGVSPAGTGVLFWGNFDGSSASLRAGSSTRALTGPGSFLVDVQE